MKVYDAALVVLSLRVEVFQFESFFSEADRDDPNDYKLDFEERQTLQRLRRKLIKAAAVLDAGICLGDRIKGVLEKMSAQLTDEAKETILLPFLYDPTRTQTISLV